MEDVESSGFGMVQMVDVSSAQILGTFALSCILSVQYGFSEKRPCPRNYPSMEYMSPGFRNMTRPARTSNTTPRFRLMIWVSVRIMKDAKMKTGRFGKPNLFPLYKYKRTSQ